MIISVFLSLFKKWFNQFVSQLFHLALRNICYILFRMFYVTKRTSHFFKIHIICRDPGFTSYFFQLIFKFFLQPFKYFLQPKSSYSLIWIVSKLFCWYYTRSSLGFTTRSSLGYLHPSFLYLDMGL